MALLTQLPEGSRTKSALRGDESDGWTVESYLTAALIDAVRENTWVLASANSKRRPKRPESFYRPSPKKKNKTSAFAAMARAAYRKKT